MGFSSRGNRGSALMNGQLISADGFLKNSFYTFHLFCQYESVLGCNVYLHDTFLHINLATLVTIYVTLIFYLYLYSKQHSKCTFIDEF